MPYMPPRQPDLLREEKATGGKDTEDVEDAKDAEDGEGPRTRWAEGKANKRQQQRHGFGRFS